MDKDVKMTYDEWMKSMEPLEHDNKKIFKIIPTIIGEIDAIEKKKTGTVPWPSRGFEEFLNVLNPLLAKHGCFILPTVIDRQTFDRTVYDKHGEARLNFHVLLRYKFTIYADDGSFVEAAVDGESSDFSDKACGKALSYSLKRLMECVFCIPTKETADPDKEAKPLGSLKETPKVPPKIETKIKPSKELESLTHEPILPKQVEELRTARESAKLSQEDILKMVREVFNKENVKDLQKFELSLLVAMVKKKAIENQKQ